MKRITSTPVSRSLTPRLARSAWPQASALLRSGTASRTLTTTTTTGAILRSKLTAGAARRSVPLASGQRLARRAFATSTSSPEREAVQMVLDSLPKGSKRFWRALAGLGATTVVLATCQPWCVVPAGHVGILDFFGDVSDHSLAPGFHLKNPLAKCVVFSTQTQRVETIASVPSREGLTVQLEVSALYRLDPLKVQHIYKTVGRNYADVVLMPHFKSIIRELTSAHEAKGLYTAQVRTEISTFLTKQLNDVLRERGIIIDETPINGITMPQRLVHAIEEKLRAEQESERMSWVLQREEAEAKRKVIEAKGIADFQKIVTQGISEQLLRWKGIEATEKLATSSNAKMVVIGKSDGLPLVLAP